MTLSSAMAPTAAAQTFPSTVDLSASFSWLSNGMQVAAMAHDASGNIYLAGSANIGFPAATKTIGPAGNSDIFVVKLNPAGDQILYATAIGGTGDDRLKDIKVDSAGNVYFVGATTSQDFPATKLFRPTYPIGGFVAKLAASGTTLSYATIVSSRVSMLDVDVDANGAAYIVGSANSQDLPTTPGVLDPSPANGADPNAYVGYIAKVAVDGSTLDLATYYGSATSVSYVAVGSGGSLLVRVDGNIEGVNTSLSQQQFSTPTGFTQSNILVESSGSILVAGASPASGVVGLKRFGSDGTPSGLDTTVELKSANLNVQMAETPGGQIFLFGDPVGPTGQPSSFTTVNATQTCLSNMAGPGGIAGIAQHNASGGLIGSVGGTPANNHAMIVLDSSGTVVHSTFFSTAIEALSVSPVDQRVYAAGEQVIWGQPPSMWQGLLRINPDLIPTTATLSPSCLVHAGTFGVVPVTPGALMTFYGSNLGPGTTGDYTTGSQFTLDADNKVGPNLGGVSITVDGIPAAMLFAWTKQINFVIPWNVRTDGTAVPVCITYNTDTKCISASTGVMAPGAFQVYGQSATINVDDGSINYSGNPARRGSAVSVFVTGTGKLNGTLIDGGVSGLPLAMVPGAHTAYFSSTASNCSLFSCDNFPKDTVVDVPYVGAAYGLVEGVTQINLIIPADMPPGPNKLFVVDFTVPGQTTPVSLPLRISVAE